MSRQFFFCIFLLKPHLLRAWWWVMRTMSKSGDALDNLTISTKCSAAARGQVVKTFNSREPLLKFSNISSWKKFCTVLMICQSILCICDVLLTSRFNRERAVTDTDSVSQSIIVFQLVFVIMANLGEGRQQWTQWTTMDNNGQQWTTMDNNGHQWTTVDTNGQQWTTMDNSGQQWTTIDNNG